MRAAKVQVSLALAKTRLRCFKIRHIPNFLNFFSRLTQAEKAQARLCIGISSTEPSLLENAITVHCEIFQIKHWNIDKNLFSEKCCYWIHTIRTPIQGLPCLPRYKDNDFKPRTQSVKRFWILIMTGFLSDLIWVQTVCKC